MPQFRQRVRFRPLWQASRADQVLRVLLILLADVLHELFIRPQPSVERHRERLGVGAWIGDGRRDIQGRQTGVRL